MNACKVNSLIQATLHRNGVKKATTAYAIETLVMLENELWFEGSASFLMKIKMTVEIAMFMEAKLQEDVAITSVEVQRLIPRNFSGNNNAPIIRRYI